LSKLTVLSSPPFYLRSSFSFFKLVIIALWSFPFSSSFSIFWESKPFWVS
jgi:hypothetical protein